MRNPWNPFQHIAGVPSGGSGFGRAEFVTRPSARILRIRPKKPRRCGRSLRFEAAYGLVNMHENIPLSSVLRLGWSKHPNAGCRTRAASHSENMDQRKTLSPLYRGHCRRGRVWAYTVLSFSRRLILKVQAIEEAVKVLSSLGELRDVEFEEVPVDRTSQWPRLPSTLKLQRARLNSTSLKLCSAS